MELNLILIRSLNINNLNDLMLLLKKDFRIENFLNDFIIENNIQIENNNELFYINKITQQYNIILFHNNYNLNINFLCNFKYLNTLKFGNNFNQPVDVLVHLIYLEILHFGKMFNQPVKFIENLIYLKELKFGYSYGQNFINKYGFNPDINYNKLVNLHYIWFDQHFHSSFDVLTQIPKLKILHYGNSFKESIFNIKKLSCLESLCFHSINQNIDVICNLTNLTSLSLDGIFNKPIKSLKNLKLLKIIKFGINFNQSIEPLENLINLESLIFGYSFNQSIEYLIKLTNMKVLIFGEEFNQPIDILIHLIKLETIHFGFNFNQNINILKKY